MTNVSPVLASNAAAGQAAPDRVRQGRSVTWLCWMGIASEGYDIGVLGAILPHLLDDQTWRLSSFAVGLLASAALVGMFFGAFLIGSLSDRIGRKRCFLACFALFSLSMGAAAVSPTPELFAFFRFVSGIGIGGLIPVASALTTEFAPPGKENSEFALMYSGYSIGIFLASLVAFFLVEHLGWRAMVMIGALPLLALPFVAIFLPESVRFLRAAGLHDKADRVAERFGVSALPIENECEAVVEKVSFLEIFSARYRRATASFWIATFAGMVLVYGLNTWLPQIMRSAGYPLGPSILFLGVFALASSVGGLLLGFVADRQGRQRTIAAAFTVGAVTIVCLAIKVPLPLTYVLVAIAGVGTVSAAVLVTGFLASYFPTTLRATAVGWCLSFSRTGAVAGPMLGAALTSFHFPIMVNFALFAVFGLIAAGAIACVPHVREATGAAR